MNKNRYKLVFSEVRGIWVCVAEIAKSRRKSGRSQGPAKLLAAVLWLICVLPGQGYADMVVDPNAPEGHRPGLDTSANKTPVVNITAPNPQGISHNEFTKFDVNMPGVILNNSRDDAVSQIGGYVLGNPNLSGGAARAALIEVNGHNASQINGAIEALGRNLDVIIANPNGISVNGLVTVNLNNLTLTTGVPQYLANGQLGLSVNGGQISINGQGVNTGGLSYFDLVARSVLLNAPISSADQSPAAISVMTGLNDYNIDTRSLSKRSDGAGNAPLWAIDGTTLGAMYGGLIRFVSTEAGIGVRHQGLVLSAADIVINADGQIELTNRMQANGDTSITGQNISIGDKASIQGHILTLTATQDIINAGLLNSAKALSISSALFSNTGEVNALGGLSLNVHDLDNKGGALYAGTDIDIVALNQMQNRHGGVVSAQNNLRIKANTFSNAELSTMVARAGQMDLNVNHNASNAGRMIASTALTMKVGGDLFNQKTSNGTAAADAALIYGGTGLLLDVLGNIYNLDAASIQGAKGAIVELIAKDLTNSQQASIMGDTVKIKAASLTNQNQAVIRALKENDALLDIQLSGQLSNSSEGSLLSNKDINIKAGSLDNRGKDSTIYAKGKIKAELEQGVSNADQARLMAQEIALHAQSLDNDDATLQAGLADNPVGQLNIDLSQSLLNRNNGVIFSTGNAVINAQALHNTTRAQLLAANAEMNINDVLQNDAGIIGVNGKFTLRSKRLKNTAQEYAVENPAPGAATKERVGNISAGDVDFTLTESLQNDAILDGQYLSLTAAEFINGQNGQIRADEYINISTSAYQNLGKIDSQKWAKLTLTHDLDVIIDKQSKLPVALLGFSLLANKNVTIADEYITPGSLEINAKGDIINQKALISAKDLVLNAGGSIINQEKALLFANGSANLTAFERFENMLGGELLAINNIVIDATDILQRPRASIMAGKDLYMYANTITNTANYTGGVVQNNDSPSTLKNYLSDYDDGRINFYSLFIEGMKYFSSNMRTTDQALISAGGNAYIDLLGKINVTINGQSIDITKPGEYELGGQKISVAYIGRPDSAPKVELIPQGTYVIGGRKLGLTDLAKSGPKSMMVSGQTVTVVDANTVVVGQRTYNYSGVSTVEMEDKQLLTMLSSKQFAVSAMNLSPTKDAQYPQTVTDPSGYKVSYSAAGKGVFIYVDPQTEQSQEAAFDKPGTYQLGNKSFMVLANGTVILSPTVYEWSGKATHYQIGGSEVTFDDVGKLLIGGQRISYSDGKAVRYSGAGQQYTITASGTLIVGGRDLTISADPNAPQATGNAQPQIQYSGPGTLRNDGGRVEIGGNAVLSGNLENLVQKKTYKLIDLLKGTGRVTLKMEPNTEIWTSLLSEETMTYSNLYEFLDTMLVGKPDTRLGASYYYWSTDQAIDILQEKLGKANTMTPGRSQLSQIMSTIFGSSWEAEINDNLAERWRNFKSATEQDAPVLSFFADNKTEFVVGGNFYQADGYFRNGSEDAVPKQRKVDVNIGEKTVQVVTGAPDAIVNSKDLAQVHGSVKILQEMNQYLLQKNTLNEGVSLSQPLEQKVGEGSNAGDIKPKTYPLYETRLEFIDQSLYFGSDYFFQKLGYRADGTVPVLADNYLTTQALLNTVRATIGSLMTARDGLSGPELIKQLMDYALAEGTKQGLTVGRDLTAEQISKLDKDIVWYVIEEVDGVMAMVPKVYFTKATLALYQHGPDIQRNVEAADNGGALQAARAMVASHGGMLIDASNINNQDGEISGNKGVYASSGDDVVNAASTGMNGGIWSQEGTVKLTADDQVLNRGATIQGDNVIIKARELATELGVGYDSNGEQIVRNDGMISATGDKDSGINIITDGDMTLQAARMRGPNVILDAGANVNFNHVMLSESEASSTTTTAPLGLLHETLRRSSAYSTGANIQAIMQKPASNQQAPDTDKSSEASNSNTTAQPSYVGGTLSVTAQQDITMVDGSYSGDKGIFNSLNGNVKTVAGQEYRYEKKTSLKKEFSVGASASFAGYGGGASYGTISGGKTNKMVHGKGQQSSSNNATNQGANINRGSELASAQFGYSQSESEDVTQGLYHHNLSLNFNSGLSILAGNGQVDIGGADMTTADTGFINIKAESVVSTKYKDEEKTYHKQKDVFFGIKTEAHSSLAGLANLVDKTVRDSKDGKKIDPAMTTGAAAGVITDLIFGDTIGGSTSIGVNYAETETTSKSTSENINKLRSGNISIQSTKGDISLAGVDIQAKNKLDIDAAGNFNVRAAEKKVETSSTSFSVDASISKNYGANAILQQTYTSDNLNVSGSYSETESSETTYTNSKLQGLNVNVRSGKDTNLTGAAITGDNINVDIAGDLNVKSLQDTKRSTTWSVNAGLSVGAAAGVIGDAAPYVAPTVSVTAGGGKSWDNSAKVNERAGIMATNRLDGKVAGNTNLTGSTIGSDSGEGNFKTEGKTTATVLNDTRDKDGFNVGGTFGFSKSGLPSATLTGSRDEQIKQESTQNAAVLLKDYQSGGGIQGDLKTQKEDVTTINKDETVASTDIMLTISDPTTSKKKGPNGEEGPKLPRFAKLRETDAGKKYQDRSTPRTVEDSDASSVSRHMADDASPQRLVQADIHDAPPGMVLDIASINPQLHADAETQTQLANRLIDNFGIEAEQYLPGPPKLSDAETMGVGLYTNGLYEPLNKALRSGQDMDSGLKAIDQSMQTALPKLSDGELMKTYRGGSLPEGQDGKEGSVIKDAGYLSTSKDEGIAKRFADRSNAKEYVVFGKSGADTSGISIDNVEREILYNKGTEFEVQFKTPDNKRIVMAEKDMPAGTGHKYKQDLAGMAQPEKPAQDASAAGKSKSREAEDIVSPKLADISLPGDIPEPRALSKESGQENFQIPVRQSHSDNTAQSDIVKPEDVHLDLGHPGVSDSLPKPRDLWRNLPQSLQSRMAKTLSSLPGPNVDVEGSRTSGSSNSDTLPPTPDQRGKRVDTQVKSLFESDAPSRDGIDHHNGDSTAVTGSEPNDNSRDQKTLSEGERPRLDPVYSTPKPLPEPIYADLPHPPAPSSEPGSSGLQNKVNDKQATNDKAKDNLEQERKPDFASDTDADSDAQPDLSKEKPRTPEQASEQQTVAAEDTAPPLPPRNDIAKDNRDSAALPKADDAVGKQSAIQTEQQALPAKGRKVTKDDISVPQLLPAPDASEVKQVYRFDFRSPSEILASGFEGTRGDGFDNRVFGDKTVFTAKDLAGVLNFGIESMLNRYLTTGEKIFKKTQTENLYKDKTAYLYKVDIQGLERVAVADDLGIKPPVPGDQSRDTVLDNDSRLLKTFADSLQKKNPNKSADEAASDAYIRALQYYNTAAKFTHEMMVQGPITPDRIEHIGTVLPEKPSKDVNHPDSGTSKARGAEEIVTSRQADNSLPANIPEPSVATRVAGQENPNDPSQQSSAESHDQSNIVQPEDVHVDMDYPKLKPRSVADEKGPADSDYASLDDFATPKPDATKAEDAQPAPESDYASLDDFAKPKPDVTKPEDAQPAPESDYASLDDVAKPKPDATKAEDAQPDPESDYASLDDFAKPKPDATKAEDAQPAPESDYASLDDFATPKPDATKAEDDQPAPESDYASLDDFAKPESTKPVNKQPNDRKLKESADKEKADDGIQDGAEDEAKPPLPPRNPTDNNAHKLEQQQLADRLISEYKNAQWYLGDVPNLSKAEAISVGLYTGDDSYKLLNDALRSGEALTGGIKDIDLGLKTALPKLSDGKVVKTYRGGKLAPDQSGAEGTIITDKGYLSTTKVLYTGKAFAKQPGNSEFIVFGNSGADVSSLSKFGALEKEILYPKNTSFNSLLVSPDGHKIVMDEAGMPKDVGNKYEQDLAGVEPKAPAAEAANLQSGKPKAKEAEDIALARDMDGAQSNAKDLRSLTKLDNPSDVQQDNTQITPEPKPGMPADTAPEQGNGSNERNNDQAADKPADMPKTLASSDAGTTPDPKAGKQNAKAAAGAPQIPLLQKMLNLFKSKNKSTVPQKPETLIPQDSGSASDDLNQPPALPPRNSDQGQASKSKKNQPQPDEVAERLIKTYGPKAEFILNDDRIQAPEFLSDGEIMSIGLYSKFEYSELNIKLRNEKEHLTDAEDALDQGLQSGLKKLSTDELMKTYRGGVIPNKEQPGEGKSFTDHGYFSTSTDYEVAKEYGAAGHKKLLILFGKSGGDISALSRFPGEKEILYPKNTQFNQLFVAPDGRTVIAEEDGLPKTSGRKYEQDLNEQPKAANSEDHDIDSAQRRKSMLDLPSSQESLTPGVASGSQVPSPLPEEGSANSKSTPSYADSSSDTPALEKKVISAASDSNEKDKAEASNSQKPQTSKPASDTAERGAEGGVGQAAGEDPSGRAVPNKDKVADKPGPAVINDAEAKNNLRSGFDDNPVWQEINKTTKQQAAFNEYLKRTYASENIDAANSIDQMSKQDRPVTLDDLKDFYNRFVHQDSDQQINVSGASHKQLKESLDNNNLHGALQGMGAIQKELLANLKGSYSEFTNLMPKTSETTAGPELKPDPELKNPNLFNRLMTTIKAKINQKKSVKTNKDVTDGSDDHVNETEPVKTRYDAENNIEEQLGDIIGEGGSGFVYQDKSDASYVIKKFKRDVLFLGKPLVDEKSINDEASKFAKYYGEDAVERIRTNDADYLRMLKVPGVSLAKLTSLPEGAVESFHRMMMRLDSAGITHGDINEENFLYSKELGEFFPIDLGSNITTLTDTKADIPYLAKMYNYRIESISKKVNASEPQVAPSSPDGDLANSNSTPISAATSSDTPAPEKIATSAANDSDENQAGPSNTQKQQANN